MNQNKTNQVKGRNIWLSLFIISILIINPLGFLISFIHTLNEGFDTRNFILTILQILIFLGIIGWSIYSGVLFLQKKENAVYNAQNYLLSIGILGLYFFNIYGFGVLLYSIICFLYLNKSNKVLTLFPKTKTLTKAFKIIDVDKKYPFNWDAVLFYIFGCLIVIIIFNIRSISEIIDFLIYNFRIIKFILIAILLIYLLYHKKLNAFLSSLIFGFLTTIVNSLIYILPLLLISDIDLKYLIEIIIYTPSEYLQDFLPGDLAYVFDIKHIISDFLYNFTLLYILKTLFKRRSLIMRSTLIAFFSAIVIYRIIFYTIGVHESSLILLNNYDFVESLFLGLFFYFGIYIYVKNYKITEESLDSQTDNTSGQGKGAQIPPQILRWNWGAFFLHWLWGIPNRVYKAFLVFIPGVNFILASKGNEWAWRNRKWKSIEHFQNVQRKWSNWGIALFFISIILYIIWIRLIHLL